MLEPTKKKLKSIAADTVPQVGISYSDSLKHSAKIVEEVENEPDFLKEIRNFAENNDGRELTTDQVNGKVNI